MDIRTPFTPRVAVTLDFGDEKSLTKQSQKNETDINRIMAKYRKTGVITHLAANPPVYRGDEQPVDFQDALNKAAEIKSEFEALPALLRNEFENDPFRYIRWQAENAAEIAQDGLVPSLLGLVAEQPEEAPEAPQGAPQGNPPAEPAEPPPST